MKEIIENLKNDPKGKTKVTLGLYLVFFLIVAVYAISLGRNDNISSNIQNETKNNSKEINENIFAIPENYNYDITININDKIYKYTGMVKDKIRSITKEKDNETYNYKYDSTNYYVENNGVMVLTKKDEVYDIIDYNYLDLEIINKYLSTAEKNNNQYSVYLKDIILGNDSEDYFLITINNNEIIIDYQPLFVIFDNKINKYNVEIKIEEIIE